MRTLGLLLLAAAPVAAGDAREALARLFAADTPAQRAKARRALVAALEGKTPAEARTALAAGPRPDAAARRGEKLVTKGRTTHGYAIAYDGKTYLYAIDLPRTYDPERPHPVLLDPGHGTGRGKAPAEKAGFLDFYRGRCDDAKLRDWIVVRSDIVEEIGPDARGLPEDVGARLFHLLLRDLGTRVAIDPDRVYVAGLSQTGFWTWMLGRELADRCAGLAPMAAVTWELKGYEPNLLHVPAFVLHGAKDAVCPVDQPRATCRALALQGAPVRYHEVPTGAHDGRVFGQLDRALKWLAPNPRVRYPKRVSRALQTLHTPWAYWLRVDGLARAGQGRAGQPPAGALDGVLDGQTVRLYGDGVTKATIGLAPEMLDLAQPVTVVWNGKTVFEGTVAPSVATLVELVDDRADWTLTFPAKIEVKAP